MPYLIDPSTFAALLRLVGCNRRTKPDPVLQLLVSTWEAEARNPESDYTPSLSGLRDHIYMADSIKMVSRQALSASSLPFHLQSWPREGLRNYQVDA